MMGRSAIRHQTLVKQLHSGKHNYAAYHENDELEALHRRPMANMVWRCGSAGERGRLGQCFQNKFRFT